jgi:hypothetical protein
LQQVAYRRWLGADPAADNGAGSAVMIEVTREPVVLSGIAAEERRSQQAESTFTSIPDRGR